MNVNRFSIRRPVLCPGMDHTFLATCVLVVRKAVRSVCGEFRRTIILNASFLQPHDGIARIPCTEMVPYDFIIFGFADCSLAKAIEAGPSWPACLDVNDVLFPRQNIWMETIGTV